MAAYAALASLINIMEQVKIHPRLSPIPIIKRIESLRESVDILLEFIESYTSSDGARAEAEVLEREIAAAAQSAEDVIESLILDLISAGFTEKTPNFQIDLQKVKEEMDSVKEKVTKFEEERGLRRKRLKFSEPAALPWLNTSAKTTTMVGFDGYSSQLMDLLISQSDRQIIPIVGMGGVGKTTLARNAYDSSIALHHFGVRAWVTVSLEYNLRDVFSETLSSLGFSASETDEIDDLAEKLYKVLSGRRYLVVLDDMWSVEAWNKVKFFFPENRDGSRIVLTTREKELADVFGEMAICLNVLDDSDSWKLFCEKAFGQRTLNAEVEALGRSIAKRCNGHPLSIVAIAGIIGRSCCMKEYWEDEEATVASMLKSIKNDHCLNMLSLSYDHLPAHLKPCLLYFGIFPEDRLISVPKLIKLWVAEGFIRPDKKRTLEKAAADYLEDLVGRNLILVHSRGSTGMIKTVYVHDLVRDLCLKIGKKEKFFCVVREVDAPQDLARERRIVIHERIEVDEYDTSQVLHLKPTPLARSMLFMRRCHYTFKSRFLRVLANGCGSSPDTVFQQVNLRHLQYRQDVWITFKLPPSISLLWSLQTLIIQGCVDENVGPPEIWEMPQLRHLKLYWFFSLPDPPLCNGQDALVLQNLQTLVNLKNFRCSEEVCKRMPNIRRLVVTFDDYLGDFHTVSNVGRLHKLESLKYVFRGDPERDVMLQNLKFPRSLKKLTLEGCKLLWEDLTIVGSLPHLEYLDLEYSVFGPEWNPNEGEFPSLRYLEILCCMELVNWNADKYHFPVLEELVLVRLWNLEEIPLSMGEISTLRDICVDECSSSAAVSAVRILEEQEGYGNEDLRVQVRLKDEKPEDFRERLETEGLTTENFQLLDAR